MKTPFRYLGILFIAVICVGQDTQRTGQNPREIYDAFSNKPSTVRWCLPVAGDDPAGIITGVCRVYSECLGFAGFNAQVDEEKSPSLSEDQITSLKKCHQAVYNAARVNPQIKGSKATQDWLLHNVYRGTEAKAFDVPSFMSDPR